MSYAEIRKLRKKLRQIENLERLDRELTEEESAKVSSKKDTRVSLQQLTAGSVDEFSTCVFGERSIDISTSISNDSFSEQALMEDKELDDDILLPMVSNLKPYENVDAQRLDSSVTNKTYPVVNNTLPQTKVCESDAPPQTKACKSDAPPQSKACKSDSDVPPQTSSKENLPNSSSTSKNKRKHTPDLPADSTQKKTRDVSIENKLKHSCDFFVGQLKGHEGVVRAVSMVGDYLVTSSQDTTIKVWSLSRGIELRSLGGHSELVSAVSIISFSLCGKLVDQLRDNEDLLNSSSCYQPEEDDFLILSAALDCTFRLWSLLSGVCFKSVYTFHPLTSVSFLDNNLVICGSDGGKLEVWDPVRSSGPLESILTHEDAITSIVVSGLSVYCGSSDGLVSVMQWSEDRLSRLYESTDAKLSNGSVVCHRQIHCIAVHEGKIYYGDDGMNIKVLDWKTGVVNKLTNHTTEFGSTRGLSVANGFLVSSGYDLDNGIGYVNVWSIPEGKYLYTLCDVQTEYIQCVSCRCVGKEQLAIVTGGRELKTWTPAEHRSLSYGAQDEVLKSIYVSRFDKEPRHSDTESDSDADEQIDSSSSSDDSTLPWHRPEPVSTSTGWLSWCSLQ